MALTHPITPAETGNTTDIYMLLDESGSMSRYTMPIRQHVSAMIEGNFDPSIKYTVITFSESTEHGSNLERFRTPRHGSTAILPAFQLIHNLVNKRTYPTKIIVVFVSDGMDSFMEPSELSRRLKELGPLPIPSLLFTIGVEKDFPTGLVVDDLRPLYHTGHASIQSVLPVNSPDHLSWAFGQLEALMLGELISPTNIPPTVDNTTATKTLILYAQAKYNECVIQCAATGRTPQDNYQLIFDTKAAITEVSKIAKARWTADKAISSYKQPVKPLVSNLLHETVYSAKACLSSTLSAIARLNKLLDEASRGKIISQLSDEAKKELLGGQYVEGKLISVANKYRAANFSTTKNSLMRLLRTYTPKDYDKTLEDTVYMVSQSEYFEDARNNLQDLIPLTHTLPGILKMLSFVCRTITFKEPLPIDALQMNEWLAEVEALPQLIRHMTTCDFLERHNSKFNCRGEKINGLMVLGGDQTSPGIFHHVQSLLLLKHPGLFSLSARLAVAASVLFYILGSHDNLSPWMHQELQTVQDVCSNYLRTSLENWFAYIETTLTKDFRMCLATESPKLPYHCKCPGLTKFILALYVAISGVTCSPPRIFTIEELKDRHQAMVVEFIARTRIDMASCLDFNTQSIDDKADAFINELWNSADNDDLTTGDTILASSLILHEAQLRFMLLVQVTIESPTFMMEWLSDAKLTTRRLKSAKHYQFTLTRIDLAFKNLASLCGHGDEVKFTLNKAYLLQALKITQTHQSGYERYTNHQPMKPMARAEIISLTYQLAKTQLRQAILARVNSTVEKHYTEYHKSRHSELARVIPACHIQRFKDEFHLDIGKDWAVNASGLSTNACCSPKCAHYLDLLNQNIADKPPNWYKHQRKSKSTNIQHQQQMQICPLLHQHLMIGTTDAPMPAFHKTVAMNLDTPAQTLASQIMAGKCLSEPRLNLPKTQNQDSFLPPTLLRMPMNLIPEQNKSAIQEEKKAKLILQIHRRCSAINSSSNTSLDSTITTLQNELTATTWPYEDFRDTFIAKYKKHFRLLGDDPTLLP